MRRRQVLVAFLGVVLSLGRERRTEVIEQRRIAVAQTGEQLGLGLGPVALGQVGESLNQRRARPACVARGAPALDILRYAREAHENIERQRQQAEHHQQQRHEQRQRHLEAPRRARQQHVTRVLDRV